MKKILKNILIFISYLLYEYIFIIILNYFGINYSSLSIKNKFIIILTTNILFCIFLFFAYKKEIKEDFDNYKKNYKEYLSKYFIYYIIGVLLMGISNIIIQKTTNIEISGNEDLIRKYIKIAPSYMLFSSIIYAPFVEEIIFRKSIRNIMDKKWIFIILSGVIFGVLHISDYTNINEIIMGIPYIIMGIDFAYIYYKTNNIFTTMTFHLCHNLILFIFQLL